MSEEIPILFNGDMVRAILNDSKTQTRRPVKEPETIAFFSGEGEGPGVSVGNGHSGYGLYLYSEDYPGEGSVFIRSPFGKPGDLLYVRETWCEADTFDGEPLEDPIVVGYRADKSARDWALDGEIVDSSQWNWNHDSVKWRPSIHMPKWAARIWLRVTSVRVERLQAITMDDCNAEGFEACEQFQGCFSGSWNQIYKAKGYGWDANPFVWVTSFERIER